MVLPDTLPGPAGYLEQQGFSAGLFYSLTNHESYIIAGQIISHVVVVGLGLDMESLQLDDYPKGGQVENLARHGLRLYSAALTASDDTAKFMQLMTLLEFLSNPDNYEKMEKTKKCIACHVAHDPSEYDQIMNDFRFLTSDQNTPNRGLRHNIVHLGKRLEDLLSADEREAVLKRLDRYVGITLEDFIERGDADWETIDKYRKTRRSALGIQPE
ncbi:hypothetical protein FBZ90_110104 [Nitrospirillum pindoramense]|uniref:Uncharacterized protein n=2 Tax=Nitrospirillum amazonense TaxID=28077 RepID=A0A560H1Y6_9PROT|nr:hypothetical protein FBZ90_110104 [Nitrospirillum amazonense]